MGIVSKEVDESRLLVCSYHDTFLKVAFPGVAGVNLVFFLLDLQVMSLKERHSSDNLLDKGTQCRMTLLFEFTIAGH
ncbi:hypothetical protein MTR67_008612 [Solanum verrucosum]|uniref:Uncharacterized protein n=1 Tax=Solanum verrucosum TaxID=315347 RepID=A0AAF0Q2I1_SOLVR|nr:hypothetical protein MTR67_008612 [Solanum verrucosum]